MDHRDRRVAKYKNGALVYKRLYQNELQVAMQVNADGSVSEFVYATRINVPDLIKRDSQTYRVIMDHLGSPVLVVNIADGTILDQAQYNEWGRVIAQTNPTFTPFGFAGGLQDQDTRLVRFGARDYSPQTGRWASKDPIGFNGGDTNLYRYVGNAPVLFSDPNGKFIREAMATALLSIIVIKTIKDAREGSPPESASPKSIKREADKKIKLRVIKDKAQPNNQNTWKIKPYDPIPDRCPSPQQETVQDDQ